jgi:diguanylate cyclase (GGDEF)-like protein
LVRETDFVGRYGGDEFAMLLTKVGPEIGLKVAQRICRNIGDSLCLSLHDAEVSVTFSMGVAVPCEGDTDETILQRADRALYKAKQTGRNHVVMEEETASDPTSPSEPLPPPPPEPERP